MVLFFSHVSEKSYWHLHRKVKLLFFSVFQVNSGRAEIEAHDGIFPVCCFGICSVFTSDEFFGSGMNLGRNNLHLFCFFYDLLQFENTNTQNQNCLQ